MNSKNNQFYPKKRRGMATVVGVLIFTVLMVATFSVLGPTLNAQSEIVESSKTMFDNELKKQKEDFRIVSSVDENNILNVDVHNTGQNPIEVPTLWITNYTATDKTAKRISINSPYSIIPSGSNSNIVSSKNLFMHPGPIIEGGSPTISVIEFDNSNNNDGALCSSSSCSLDLSVSPGANRMIIVSVEDEGPVHSVASIDITGGTNQGILVGTEQVGSGNFEQNVEMWRIMESDINDGTNTITVNFSSTPSGAGISVMSFSGVEQQPEEAENSNSVTNNASISTGLTTVTDGSLIVSVVGNGQGGGSYTSHGTSQTERHDFSTTSAWHSVTTEIKPVAGYEDQSHTFSKSANRQAQYVASFAPAIESGSLSIEFDNSNNNDGALCSSSSCSIDLTVASGTNRMIIVSAEDEGPLNPVTSVDINGNTNQGILVGTEQAGSGNFEQNVEMWRIMESDINDGTNTITVNFSSTPSGAGISVMSFSGVEQQPEEAQNSNVVYSSTSITTGITTLSDESLIVSVVGSGRSGNYASHGPGQLERHDFATTSARHSVTTEIKTLAGYDDQSHTFSTSANRQAQFVAAFAPASFNSRLPYDVKVISTIGNTVTDKLYVGDSGPPYKLRTELFTIPPDVKSGQNVTLAMYVTNISNDPLVSVTPAFPIPNTSHPANIDEITPSLPTSVDLSPQETVIFKWHAQVSSINKTKVSFSNYVTGLDAISNTYEQGNPSNDYMNILGFDGSTISGKGYSVILNEELFTEAQLFSIIPSPFGHSNQKGLWGVNIVNPTHVDMYVSKVVISIKSPRDGIIAGSDRIFPTPCNPTTVPPTPSNWSCPVDNQLVWEDLTTPIKIEPKSVYPFLALIEPGSLINTSNVNSLMVHSTVYTDMGISTKTSPSSSMQFNSGSVYPIVNTFLTSDKSDPVNLNKIKTMITGISSNSTQIFNATLADFDVIATNYIDSAGGDTKLTINVPFGWSDINIIDATGFAVNSTEQTNGSYQIVGNLTSNISGSLGDEARVLQFSATAPTVLEDRLYVMHLKASGISQSPSFSIDPVTEVVLQVTP